MITSSHSRPVLVIASDMPLGRIIPNEFQKKKRLLSHTMDFFLCSKFWKSRRNTTSTG